MMDLIIVQIRGLLYPVHLAISISILGSRLPKNVQQISHWDPLTGISKPTQSESAAQVHLPERERERELTPLQEISHISTGAAVLWSGVKTAETGCFLQCGPQFRPRSVTGITVSIHSAMSANVGASVSKQRQAFHLLQGLFFPSPFPISSLVRI